MDNFLVLLLMSFAMLIGCYIFGIIPLAFNLSEDRLKILSIFGAGLLIGTALAVIIPEGIHALNSADHKHCDHSHESGIVAGIDASHEHHNHQPLHALHKLSKIPSQDKQADLVGADSLQHMDHPASNIHGAPIGAKVGVGIEEDIQSEPAHYLIGLVLVAGFVFMMLVDQCSSRKSHRHFSNMGGSIVGLEPDLPMTGGSGIGIQSGGFSSQGAYSTTLGLIVHAAADGVALGAAATSSRMHVEFIVFMAIMLHKAPAALGLTTFLMHEGLDRPLIRRNLMLFSLAAPLMAICTFIILRIFSQGVSSDMNYTGLSLLFSGGTFLYVATVHVLPEVTRGAERFTAGQLTANIIGTALPLLLSLTHSHKH